MRVAVSFVSVLSRLAGIRVGPSSHRSKSLPCDSTY
jgi:hypothetical protein